MLESYTSNGVVVTRRLGRVRADSLLARDEPESLSRRRSNLHGAKVVAVTETSLPRVTLRGSHEDARAFLTPSGDQMLEHPLDSFVGSFIDVLEHLADDLNFTVRLLRREDGLWGTVEVSKDGTRKYNGMLLTVSKGEADIIAAPFSNSDYRFEVVDFLPALDVETPAITISRADVHGQTNWQLYFSPFSSSLWLFMTGT